jgi:hypothetical protein
LPVIHQLALSDVSKSWNYFLNLILNL